jgi:hypothetical protein
MPETEHSVFSQGMQCEKIYVKWDLWQLVSLRNNAQKREERNTSDLLNMHDF